MRPYRQLNPTIFIICRWVTAGEPCPKEGETKPNRGNAYSRLTPALPMTPTTAPIHAPNPAPALDPTLVI